MFSFFPLTECLYKYTSDVLLRSRRNDLLPRLAHGNVGKRQSDSKDRVRGGRGEPRPEGLGDRKARHPVPERVGEVRDQVPPPMWTNDDV